MIGTVQSTVVTIVPLAFRRYVSIVICGHCVQFALCILGLFTWKTWMIYQTESSFVGLNRLADLNLVQRTERTVVELHCV